MEKQNQDRRLKMMQQGDNQQQPQKCPRCESMNTKFCYYNNYSLSQPRYFCKTCRRYWTQGGTLRNVPVGGGCRKGKRMKTSSNPSSSSSGENSRLSLGNTNTNTTSAAPDHTDLASSSFNYPGGGFLNPLAGIQSLSNQTQTVPQSFPLINPNLGGISSSYSSGSGLGLGSGNSNLNLLHGFNAIAAAGPSFGPQRPFYNQHQNWHQSFLPDTALWSISTSTTSANNNSASFPLNPSDHQWHEHGHEHHHLPGYGPPT